MKWQIFMLLLVLFGCKVYTPQPHILPEHIRKIAVRPIYNKTPYNLFEERLTLKIIDEFTADGRFQITEEKDTEGILVGEIVHYILQPLVYGPNFEPIQYKLRVILNIYFVDKVHNCTLWEEPNFEEVYHFSAPTLPGGMTEEEVREIIWEKFAKRIVRRVVEGFGSETGISIKKVPKR